MERPGQYPGGQESGGFGRSQAGQPSNRNQYQSYYDNTSTYPPPPTAAAQPSPAAPSFFDRVHAAVHRLGSSINEALTTTGHDIHAHIHPSGQCTAGTHGYPQYRFLSFAPPREGNDIKWFVDGCGYFWAVSEAIENARESIWILDWWLSPEIYLRRPPSRYEQYRLDRMLQAAAQRGVKINVIVYKEVPQALTLDSEHTKHALEALHPNIAVFRHPDHVPDARVFGSSLLSAIKNTTFSAANLAKLPGDALKALYGVNEDSILFWAHHEKLCIVDGKIAFMGGLDLCFGRWDTNQHSIADVHPGGLDQIVFPGQDYNNARIIDFQNVSDWQKNELDRTTNSRMGWSDLSMCLSGPVVDDLKDHFMQRWNFIYDEKYDVRKDRRYGPIVPGLGHYLQHAPNYATGPSHPLRKAHGELQHGFDGAKEWLSEGSEGSLRHMIRERFAGTQPPTGNTSCQITRSCAKWSHGVPVQHSVANAYIEIIRESKHFVYIENQFFITATSDAQRPVKNKIGAAIAERIIRAARNGEKYKMIIVIPSVPAFAGDLRSDKSLATRAIMNFQYKSINRGGHSIMEQIAAEGFDPLEYIRFYNLRNYDRINVSLVMQEVEQGSGVPYDQARKQHDNEVGGHDANDVAQGEHRTHDYNRYQAAAQKIAGRGELESGRWDSVAECYMLGGVDIREVPWQTGVMEEIDAFVSEELYIHTKLLIADDRIVICGSANLNDRSQLGYHDSEIAVVVEDSTPVDSYMNGQPWQASRFAASLRRQLFRKHMGLLRPQNLEGPDQNFEPVGIPNTYDWGSQEDLAVVDPLSEDFQNNWNWRARVNTDAFSKVFHPVPDDRVQTWKQYDEYYERFFKDERDVDHKKPSTYKWGHVVAEEFPPGEAGIKQVKEVLSTIQGTLVEMPLLFLKSEDIAKEGLELNAFTAEVYT